MYRIRSLILNFFTNGHERTLLAKKNIIASFGLKGISIAINLALVPLTINYVNPTQYGIWLTLSSIIAWFAFFDIGFGHGLRNKFAESKAIGNVKLARTYVSTTYALLGIIFATVWLLFFISNHFIDWTVILNTSNNMISELSTLALIVFSFFCLQIVFKTINTIVIADQKPAIASLFDMIGQLIALIIIIILTKTTEGSLIKLGLALGFAPIFVLALSSIWLFLSQYKFYKPSIKYVDFKYAKDIMGLGIKFFIIQISAVFIFQTTNIITTQLLGSEQVTVYNITYKYFFVALTLFNIILSPFWSAFTDAYAKRDYDWMKKIVKKLNKIWYLFFFLILFMILVADWFYKIWIGDKVEIPFMVSVFMAINLILATRFNLFIAFINGVGKIKLQLFVNLILVFAYIPIAIYFGKKYGLIGIIGANSLIYLIYSIITPLQLNLILNKKAKGIWNK